GHDNTALGFDALYKNTTGGGNTAVGTFSLNDNNSGAANTAVGVSALESNTTGTGNTAIGQFAGNTNNNSNCTFVGRSADGSGSFTNSTALGYNSSLTASNQVRIGSASVTSIGGYVDWSNISDGRYKKEIKENVPGLKFINMLKPITYHLDIPGIKNFLGEDHRGDEADERNAIPSDNG